MKNIVSIMPCLDVSHGRVVKGIHFADLIDAGDPVALATRYQSEGADELGFFDTTASREKRPPDFALLRRVAEAAQLPVMAGGGLQTLADVEAALEAGARSICLTSAAFLKPSLVEEAVQHFGAEVIGVSIDAERNSEMPSTREVYIQGGEKPTGVDALEFAKRMAGLGIGRLLPCSKPGDGSKRGYDLDLIRGVADTTKLPTVASGGAGKLIHFLEAVKEGHARTLLAASVFHFNIFTVRQVKTFLANQGVKLHNPPVARM
jgi:imidazole glycerol-phosphate synthase subunit HisF